MTETPDDEPAVANYVVTCETDGCGNAGHAIPITAPADNPYVVCGVCSQPISNIKSGNEATTNE